ncbi:hypothetical protein F3157_15900 [Virgibacillus dakarensis]|uniref:Uncharacterized protein n=1 Tax=Lentibacillus populi TaxID=1827502 RepID=A0A9W5TXN4_9BACI|nr:MULTISPECIES: hypothetical protein [Bacillaceae]MBT2217776.1 hypothetical protein [Virgibacillus dakarensis]MTW87130.1 hypothetical protein [Virgibacillus dakarensis]GGB41966.1 hypothetical protein GCM10011409_19400 [Lentibacillus populi]
MQNNRESRSKRSEMLLWSIAFPGFGQLLNAHYIKGLSLIALEFIVNVQGNFNTIIVLSYHGKIQEAIEQTNYQWLMFYPCLYFFAIWDAYRGVGGGTKPYSFMPFVFSAYFVTLGLIFSPKLTLFGVLIGPMWLPILFLPIGIVVGFIIQFIMLKVKSDETGGRVE